MKKIRLILILSAILMLLSSCSDRVKAPDDSWEDIFLQYWNEMNNEYVHFSDDASFDWDEVYDKYLPLFQELDYTDKEDSIIAFRYFKEIAFNVHDNHYNLKVTDGFGQSLRCSPALLQKYAETGGDIMSWPDLTLVGNYGVPYPTSINDSGRYYDGGDKLEYYKAAIPSFTEISDLGEEKDEDTEAVTKKSYFHCVSGDIDTEFPDGAYCGASFETVSDEKVKAIGASSEIEGRLALKWNIIVNTLSLSSYFYGVNKDGVLYVYFSDFGNAIFLLDTLTKDEKDFNDRDREYIKVDAVKTLRGYIEEISDALTDGTITDPVFKSAAEEGIKGLRGLPGMYESLTSVTAEDKCTINGKEKTGIKGVIVDIRGNSGGAVSFLEMIWGSFFSSETKFGYVRYKSGYSRLEYTPWTSFSIEKDYVNEKLSGDYSRPVAVLVNGFSVSCSEVSCIIAKLLPSTKIIGHTTFGGTCALTDRKLFNGGPFESAHLSVYTTTYQFVDNDMVSYETKGITPDIETELDKNRDDAYIKAVEWITTGSTT